MIGRWLVFLVLVLTTACTLRVEVRLPRAAAQLYVSNVGSATLPGGGANNCQSSSTPCHVPRALTVAVCGDTINLLPGTYTGANYVLNLDGTYGGTTPTASNCSLGNEVTVRAVTDGTVRFDGGGTRIPFGTNQLSYWNFSGFDATNGEVGGYLWDSHHLTIQRVCVSNSQFVPPFSNTTNSHIFLFHDSHHMTLEDICIFGTGRTGITEANEPADTNTFRRIWIRWEGAYARSDLSPLDCGGTSFQTGYYSQQNSRMENIITIFSGEQTISQGASHPCNNTTSAIWARGYTTRNQTPIGQPGNIWRGIIGYGYSTPSLVSGTATTYAWFRNGSADDHSQADGTRMNAQDIFMDARSFTAASFAIICAGATCNNTLNRLTGLNPSGGGVNGNLQSGSGTSTNVNNCNEPNALASCPDFYTGTLGGTQGARNCFEYTNGVLGTVAATQGLWPWRMDTGGSGAFPSRIKSALAYERAAGRGGSALQGSAGSGYEAGTVTSEIAARYGPIPAGCSRTTTSFVPDFPVATDFPSTSVLDDFNRASIGANYTWSVGPGFTITSNQAVGPAATVTRGWYSAGAYAAAHEAYGTWITIPTIDTVLLQFGGPDLTTNGYHLVLTRSGGNAFLRVARITGGYTEVLGPISLGTDVTNGQSFGVRVSSLQTITVYWKYTDGTWYRIGSVIDTNLPTANTRIGFGSNDGAVIENFGGGTCCGGGPVSPGNIGRFGNLYPKQ